MTADTLLSCVNLNVSYPGPKFGSAPTPVLKDVSLYIRRGETVGLVGESGSGKTTLGRAILGLAPIASGQVLFEGMDYAPIPLRKRRNMARKMQVIFQDPYTSLNPTMTVEEILTEPLASNGIKDGAARIRTLLERVNLPRTAARRIVREFSGGQRQRIAIARALALDPQLIICDEPTSALDLSTQRKVLDLLLEIQEETGTAYLFITHDLAVVRHMSHRLAVMLGGEIVETGPTAQVTEDPKSEYTRRLLLASPVSNPQWQRDRRRQRQELATNGASL